MAAIPVSGLRDGRRLPLLMVNFSSLRGRRAKWQIEPNEENTSRTSEVDKIVNPGACGHLFGKEISAGA
jgi:hypothetical protein